MLMRCSRFPGRLPRGFIKAGIPPCAPALLLLVLSGLINPGCSTPTAYDTTERPQTPWEDYKYFALLPFPEEPLGETPVERYRLKPAIHAAVKTGMNGIGILESTVTHADVLIQVKGRGLPMADATEYGLTGYPYFGHGGREGWVARYPYGGMPTANLEPGTLTVEVYDRQRKELVWVGWTTGHLRYYRDMDSLRQAIIKVLQRFPR